MPKRYAEIIRPSNCLMAAVAVLIGFIVAAEGIMIVPLSFSLLLGMASVFLFAAAGIVLNDYFDYHIDKINAPHRALPSGRIKRADSLLYSYFLFALALLLALFINPYCFLLALVNTVLEIFYARNFKKIAVLGNIVDSWFVASSFLFGALIIGPAALGIVPVLASLAFLANIGREIFGDIEDLKGDKKLKLKTLPIILGRKKALIAAKVFIVLAVLLSVVPWLTRSLNNPEAYIAFVIAANALFLYSLFLPPAKNQRFTKIAMLMAMIAFLAGVV